jgi:esterase
MELVYEKLGKGAPLVILHGLYGSSKNWLSVGKALCNDFEVFLIDQRNHGLSPHSDAQDYQNMQTDLLEFFEKHNIKNAVLMGHSMGGKAAMLFVLRNPEYVSKLIVVDIAPKSYANLLELQPIVNQHLNVIQGFLSIKPDQEVSRNTIESKFLKFVPDKDIVKFLLKNLTRTKDGHFRWMLNVDALSRNIPEIINGPDFTKIEFIKERIHLPVLFIKGEKSGYIKDDDLNHIKQYFPNAELVSIFEAGHMVHIDQPELFLKSLMYFLNK